MLLVPVQSLDSLQEIRDALQFAIELEHSTIPPYLTAMLSMKPGSGRNSDVIAPVFHEIVVQEMEHLGTVANILNAIGGTPAFNQRNFIPAYPGGLPFHIGDKDGKKFEVGVRALSRDVVHDTFMKIEEPHDPIHFPVKERTRLFSAVAFPDRFQTIGEFYTALSNALDVTYFVTDASRQVTGGGLSAITDPDPKKSLANARAAIEVIKRQGEGTTQDPLQGTTEPPAHYYLFAGFYYGRTLVPDASVNEKYSYSGEDVSIDPAGVYPLLPDPTEASYAPGDPAYVANRKFNSAYSTLLDQLHDTFNGTPRGLGRAIGTMYALKGIAAGNDSNGAPNGMVTLPVTGPDGKTYNASPTYTYLDPNDRVPFA